MPISEPDYQLRLPLELEEEIQDPRSQIPSPEEARLRSEAARQALDDFDLDWLEDYHKLRDGGWDWRVAAYIAWKSTPQPRKPKTQEELAIRHLGLTSDRAIINWRQKNRAIDDMVAVLQSSPLYENRRRIYDALIDVATQHDYKGHNDRKLALELLGDYVQKSKLEAELNKHIIDDLSSLPFEEKLKLAGLDDPEKLSAFVKSLNESPAGAALPEPEKDDKDAG